MLRCDLMLCAQGVIRDVQTNNISFFNIFAEITPEGFPILVQQLSIYARFQRDVQNDPSNYEFILRMNIAERTLFEHTVNVDFQDKAMNNTIINLQGLVVPTPGELQASLWHDENQLNQYLIQVHEPRQVTTETHSS